MNNEIQMVSKGAVIQTARDVLTFHHKLFDKLRDKIEKTPEVKTVYGYDINQLILFAEACRRAGIRNEDLLEFSHNAQAAYEFVFAEQERVLKDMFRRGI